ncbi:hypothetical protein [Bradyrhizobium sp. WD16]|uniref:hypothetical protein n=1 Tax=Bradyrhizobium sp. WD16 TaxID=1521768 RepID=UPI0020A4B63A|nr:hypothetical protein [Bradyrhizobium sp. WD16]UTD25772.1 hypothetical protein DB459_01445 [Bradyrhizobium sp. WD16]
MSELGSMKDISDFVVRAVDGARDVSAPFHHVTFDRFFPPDLYRQMTATLPDAADYRPMSGRARENDLADGTPTRVKIDLFPEYTRALPPEKRAVWDLVGRVLCSSELQAAFVRRMAPGLRARFGAGYDKVGLFPIPVLTRDIAGYHIAPHTDTHWKGITVLIYLPRDAATAHIGTVLHRRAADGSLERAGKGQFLPNSGFAFAVGDESWHSVDPVGPEVTTRDLIILQYFVDSGLQRILRNRGKRLGNMVLNSVRQLARNFQ